MIDAGGRQTWTVGATVRCGFMRLRIVAVRLTPGDFRPDVYDMIDDRKRTA